MKKFRILSLTAALLSLCTAFGCQQSGEEEETAEETVKISPRSIVFDWQYVYNSKLTEFMQSSEYSSEQGNESMFELYDITNDGNPELIISPDAGRTTKCDVYTSYNGSVHSLGSYGNNGEMGYIPDMAIVCDEFQGSGFVIGKFLSFVNSEFSEVMTYYDNTASAANGAVITHKINDEDVSLPKYDAALKEYRDKYTEQLGRKYTFGSETIDYAIQCSESWGAVLNSEQKESCKTLLASAITNSDDKELQPAFELCDLNNDEIPELVVSEGTSENASCRIYYFSENQLKQLDGAYRGGGIIWFDIENNVFYASTEEGNTYWSLASSDFSADNYENSGNVMQFGRKYLLTEENIIKAFK
ncbi:MAG: hypothetical protein IJ666_03715 [Ruminococcus sp.]|nr:hypothetical protein [Ruminococcus sp.]